MHPGQAPPQSEDQYEKTFLAWNQLAEQYQQQFMDLDLYNRSYDAFCRLVPKAGATIFEIGCGPGNITRYLLTQRPDYRITATDVAPEMVRLAQANNPGITGFALDCRNLDQLEGAYDGIVCGFCLPYLSGDDCAKLFRDCAALLHPGGMLYCSAIEGDPALSGPQTSSDGQYTLFIHYHANSFLETLLHDNGFILREEYRISYTDRRGTNSIHLVLIAEKTAATQAG